MAVTRRSYTGTAAPTKLNAGMGVADSSFTVTAGGGQGYPTGVNPFVITVDGGLATEEKILCSARASDTFTVAASGRGFDGTTAQTHASGASVAHTLAALDMDQVNQHAADTTTDDHTQYLNTARHDTTARHAFGAALGTRGVPTNSNPGDVAAAGTSASLAAADHLHGREAGAGITTYAKDLRGHVFAGVTPAAISLVQAQLTLIPFLVYATTTVSGFTINVGAGGSAGATIRSGLYRGDGTFFAPSTLLIDGGAVAATAAGNLSFAFTQQTTTPGLYWLAVCAQGAPATLPKVVENAAIGNSPFVTDPTTNTTNSGAGYTQASVTGALPAPAGTLLVATTVPICFNIIS